MHTSKELKEAKRCSLCKEELKGTYVVLTFVDETEGKEISHQYCVQCYIRTIANGMRKALRGFF